MLKAHPQIALVVGGLLALVALYIIAQALVQIDKSSRVTHSEEQRQQQTEPRNQNPSREPKIAGGTQDQSNDRPNIEKQQEKGWVQRTLDWVERRDKFIVAISTVMIAAFTMFLVGATVLLFRSSEKVAESAKQSADAAKEAVLSAERNAQRQLRAYVHFKEMEITVARDAGGQDVFVFQPVFKNFGNTPANIRTIIVSTRVVTDGNVEALTWPDTIEGAGRENIHIAPGLEAKGNELDVPLRDAKRLNKDYRLIYRFYVEYFTVFDELGTRKTAQVVEIGVRGDPTQAVGPPGVRPSQLFQFTAHSPGSFAD